VAAKGSANGFLTQVNATTVTGGTISLGTISYFNRTINPTPPYLRTVPVFFPYLGVKIHERLDSQRRRSGKESSFPVA
jgi:hypothetical protein